MGRLLYFIIVIIDVIVIVDIIRGNKDGEESALDYCCDFSARYRPGIVLCNWQEIIKGLNHLAPLLFTYPDVLFYKITIALTCFCFIKSLSLGN